MEEKITLSKYATAREIGQLLNISRAGVHKLSKSGDFPQPVKIGRSLRWSVETVKNWLEQQQGGTNGELRN